MGTQRDRDSRRADREKLNRWLVALGYSPSGRSLHKLIQDRLGKYAAKKSTAYRVYNQELIDRSTREALERAFGVPFEALELREPEFKLSWGLIHSASYSGPVWIQLEVKPENQQKVHRYTIRWGPWQYSGILNFEDHQTASLMHMKGDDGLSIPIFIDVSPPCSVDYGPGDPPAGPVHDINHGWIWLGKAAGG